MAIETQLIGPVIISVIVTLSFAVAVLLLMTLTINFSLPAGQAFLVLMGVLSQSFAQVTGYWLGSSAGQSRPVLPPIANT